MKQQLCSATKIFNCGDCITFRLTLEQPAMGVALLRTNLGGASIARQEIVAHTEQNRAILSRDWHDVAMTKQSAKIYSVTLPLVEIGCFEAKIWFKHDIGKPEWAVGDNLEFKVEPAANICGNSIYSVFTRQFSTKAMSKSQAINDAELLLDGNDYTVIPPSGTFRDVIARLDFIIGDLGSRVIQLLPIHPTPTCYGKMGRFGSPFAALDYFSVDAALAEFDRQATPLEQFIELVDAVHARSARIFIDIPVNHTGWGSRLHTEHPEYFIRRDDNSFVSPGAWGTVWEDLCKLDYSMTEVHDLMAEVFLYWCRKGVDGFRCDAGYMLPISAWDYIVAKVRNEYPATIFMLEGLGGPLVLQADLLKKSGLNWAYSELFQNYSKSEIENYLPYAVEMSQQCGIFVNFAETHDNNRLAAESQLHARLRTALSALLTCNGAFGISNGVEWFATEKIDVHQAGSLNWGSKPNQVKMLKRLQLILENHPAFYAGATVSIIPTAGETIIVAERISLDRNSRALILINLNETASAEAVWGTTSGAYQVECADLLSGKKIVVENSGGSSRVWLEPGAVLCLTSVDFLSVVSENSPLALTEPLMVARQRMKAVALAIKVRASAPFSDFGGLDIDKLAEQLGANPEQFCREQFCEALPPVTIWQDGVDQQRMVMVPPGDMLLIKSKRQFRVELKNGEVTANIATSLISRDGEYFVIFPELPAATNQAQNIQLKLQSFVNGKTTYSSGELLLLAQPEQVMFCGSYSGEMVKRADNYALFSNNLGGIAQVRAAWGTISSKYDAILAANCNLLVPVDRQVMFTRCRAWLVCSDYSQEFNLSCLDSFISSNKNRAAWNFAIPAGQGKLVKICLTMCMTTDDNSVSLFFHRPLAGASDPAQLVDDCPVKIILRPDIEDRCNHEITKAFLGPEREYPDAVEYSADSFSFSPSHDHGLKLKLVDGKFVWQPEWDYMVALPFEEDRGLEAHTDLFSPGYFSFGLNGGEQRQLVATVFTESNRLPVANGVMATDKLSAIAETTPAAVMYSAMRRFIVKRDNYHTVIAGYPWFLDWGRDTLICLRGMIAAGYLEYSQEIIIQFACFEQQGTIPNMIRGNDDSNRDTSDAPLWLFVAVRDFCQKMGNQDILQQKCAGRTLKQVLCSIAEYYRSGTANGIMMDSSSGLIFSPSHFTWMDTNYPAGTPREGYPIEIQALWYAALDFLDELGFAWAEALKLQVQNSIETFYYSAEDEVFADCLHAAAGVGASEAIADDACRSNQLLAVTLGAVKSAKLKTVIVSSAARLLVPGAIRSLADQAVTYPLPVYRDGKLLNNPDAPYWGNYSGDEDTRRKPAYHNGTAWCWPFPSYCEALMMTGGDLSSKRALALLMSCQTLFESGVPGQLPEIIDGNYPHKWRGCGAQAWSVTEVYRVYQLLTT